MSLQDTPGGGNAAALEQCLVEEPEEAAEVAQEDTAPVVLPVDQAQWSPDDAQGVAFVRAGLEAQGVTLPEDATDAAVLEAFAAWQAAEGLAPEGAEGPVMDQASMLALMGVDETAEIPAYQASNRTRQESLVPIHELLVATGYLTDEGLGGADHPWAGLYGTGTQDAVKRFQADHGLPTTGNLDPMTLAVMAGAEVVQQEHAMSSDEAFVSQRHRADEPEYSDTEADGERYSGRYNDCGPSSTLAVLRLFGAEHDAVSDEAIHGELDTGTRSEAILAVREEMTGGSSDTTTNFGQATEVMEEAGLSVQRISNGTHGVDDIALAVASGSVVMLAGQTGSNAWTPGEFVPGTASHIVVVSDYDPETGLFTVMDPSLDAPIQVTAEELQNFRDNDSGNAGAGRIVSAPPEGVVSDAGQGAATP